MKASLMFLVNAYKREVTRFCFVRNCSSVPQHMKAWQIHKYGNVDDLKLETTKIPIVENPTDALIEVKAASVNPIDKRMIEGYGSVAINAIRRIDGTLTDGSEFPLTLGRDFSGKIVALGKNTNSNKFRIGDEVWGTVKASYQGSFAQYVVVPSSDISFKPKSLSHVEATSFPYVTSTTWAAISCYGNLEPSQFRDKKILILGGSGGVGTFAIQLFSTWGADVVTTVSEDFIVKAVELGASNAINYNDPNCLHQLNVLGRYDLIYDMVSSYDLDTNLSLLKPNFRSKYVTIVNPFLKNINSYGVPGGVIKSGIDLAIKKLQGLKQGSHVSWGVYYPNADALDVVGSLIEKKKIVPLIDKVFPFGELPSAMEKIATGKNRGKTIVDYSL